MEKNNIIHYCTNCDAQFSKWIGRCLECGKWGSVQKRIKTKQENKNPLSHSPLSAKSIQDIKDKNISREQTGINEFDRVIGGGFVPGSFILLGGEPGIGKSTLTLQIAAATRNTLYISGEESEAQIKLRAERIMGPEKYAHIKLANGACLEQIISTIKNEKTPLAIIDSIQTIYSNETDGEPGGANQVRACGAKLMEFAKNQRTSIILIGHVTKDGNIAGPKTLEHLVDTVLYLEGDRHHNLRILRAVKNRFGPTDEVGIFDMAENGLKQVSNPSLALLEERGDNTPGSIVTCLMEGTRPMLVEIQALVSKTNFGYPIRKSSGFDLNRLHVLIAVLQKRARLNLGQYDVHVNVVGGVKANEPAADLAVALAAASAYKDKALGKDLAVFGEIGLGGEIRSVRQSEKRIRECEQLGIKRVITGKAQHNAARAVRIISVKNIQELITYA